MYGKLNRLRDGCWCGAYLGVPLLCSDLIPHRHRWRGVPDPAHQLLGGRPGLRGELRAYVAQIVHTHIGLPTAANPFLTDLVNAVLDSLRPRVVVNTNDSGPCPVCAFMCARAPRGRVANRAGLDPPGHDSAGRGSPALAMESRPAAENPACSNRAGQRRNRPQLGSSHH
jgi:hypothetical protein